MRSLIDLLNATIEAKHLLKHPFYVAWTKGELNLTDLQLYAQRYFAHVLAFPTYLSGSAK
jgi:pyrroloquinoline-quinone synthase